jgi:putative Mg2+ transporter-C (MgtC) family protein
MTLEQQIDVCVRLLVAALLSAVIGYDRERRDRPAGLRTHVLVGIGSALFTSLSIFAFAASDPARVAAQILPGIGFLGAGAIIREQGRRGKGVYGLTTAASIWAVAAIGMAAGTANYLIAAVGAVLVWFVLVVMMRMERRIQSDDSDDNAGSLSSSDPSHQTTSPKLRRY